MKLNRKLWTAALAVAMTTPSAMAAQDTAGMHYTSASEGFYASIRLRYVSNGGDKEGGSDLQNSSSRIGVRGNNDLGGGLEGFYQYEMLVNTDQGEGVSTRLGLVGLRGDFGSVVAGAFWPDTYNWVYGSTDVANRHSGNAVFNGAVGHAFGQYRTSKSLQYSTPDLNGFQGAILVKADAKSDGEGKVTSDTKAVAASTRNEVQIGPDGSRTTLTFLVPAKEATKGNKDDNNIDHWSIAAKYDVAGFSTGFSFSRYADAIERHANLDKYNAEESTRADRDSWAFKLGYSQDDWYVNSWYGEISDGDGGVCDTAQRVTTANDVRSTVTVAVKCDDTEVFSIAGGITVDKVALYAVHENVGHGSNDDAYSTLGVQYTLGSNSWTWVEYAGRDLDSSDSEDDDFSIGLGHSF